MPDALIVDDHQPTATSLAALARREGFNVAVATALDEARAHLSQHSVDVVLLDLNLPDGEGLSLLQAIDPAAPPAVFPPATSVNTELCSIRIVSFALIATDPP